MRDLRKEYGRVVLRKAEKMAYVESPPGPEEGRPREGAQLSILFATKFVRDRQATEEVLMELEKDGLWRVAGYSSVDQAKRCSRLKSSARSIARSPSTRRTRSSPR